MNNSNVDVVAQAAVSNKKPNLYKSGVAVPKSKPIVQRRTPIFHERTQSEDDKVFSKHLLKLARKTGVLNLSSRGLAQVPEKVYQINEADENAGEIKIEELTVNDDDAWWNQVLLTTLDLSSNALTQISPKIENLMSLTVLILHDNALNTLPAEISKLEKLVRLNLSRNKLKELPRQLYSLPVLRYLNISYNEFTELDPDISDLHMLEHLDASHNNIETLPGGIGFLVRVTMLLLSYNHIKELPDDLVNMRSLQKLDLMHNDLTELPQDIGLLRKLQCIYVQHNNIKELPDFDGCEDLYEVHASNNFIEAIPRNFCLKLSHLKILDLRDNKIVQLPDEIGFLRNLTRLDVSNNGLNNLPVTLSRLAHLISLQVEGNPIKSIRRDIIQCGTARILRTLLDRAQVSERERLQNFTDTVDDKMVGDGLNSPRLQGGHAVSPLDEIYPDKYKMRQSRALAVNMKNLTDVPTEVFQIAQNELVAIVDFSANNFKQLPNGLIHLANTASELIFEKNQLCSIPPFLSQFKRVTLINFSGNCLNDLPKEFGVLDTLRELNISNNKFVDLPSCIYDLKHLEILLASDNHIKTINATNNGLGALKYLTVLSLRNNDIDYVPPTLGNLTTINVLDLIGNPFRQPRHQILVKGTDAILTYLRSRIPT